MPKIFARLVVVTALLLTPITIQAYTWTTTINNALEDFYGQADFKDINRHASAIDSNGDVHFVTSLNDSVYHFVSSTSGWTSTEIDAGENAALVIEASNDKLHVSYYDPTDGDLKYAYKSATGSVWITDTIDASGDVGSHNSIALKDSDNAYQYPVFAYYDATNQALKYALRFPSGTVSSTSVDSTNDVGQGNSIAVDSQNHIHISYADQTNGQTKHAEFDGSSWSYMTTSSFSYLGTATIWGTQIKIDSADDLHIVSSLTNSYGNVNRIYYQHKGGVWYAATIVRDLPHNLQAPSFTLDSSGNPHILYCDTDNEEMHFATSVHLGSTATWHTHAIADGCNPGLYFKNLSYSSFGSTLIDFGIAHYTDVQTAEKYLRHTEFQIEKTSGLSQIVSQSTEDIQLVNGSLLIGHDSMTHFFLDTSGSYQLLFANEFDDYPYLATRSPSDSEWIVELITTSSEPQNFTAAFDSVGDLHIGWNDNISGKYQVTEKSSGSWTTTDISNSYCFSDCGVSIAIDSNDVNHMTYFDLFWSPPGLNYVENSTGSYLMSSISSVSVFDGSGNIIMIDSADHVHAISFDYINLTLRHITNESGSWVSTDITNNYVMTPDHMPKFAAVMDSNDVIHLAYLGDETDPLATVRDAIYVTNSTGSWQSTVVANDVNELADYGIAIDVDSSDEPRIAFLQDVSTLDYEIRVASYDSGTTSWTLEDVTQSDFSHTIPCARLQMKIDSSDQVQIAARRAWYEMFFYQGR